MATLDEKAAILLQNSEVVIITSVNQKGYPRPVPMSKVKSEGISVIWMATGKDSSKTKDFLSNPKAGLCFHTNGNSVALTGEVEIVTDKTMKKELWQDWFIEHFPQGPEDPGYVLIKFNSREATFWIDGDFTHRKVKQ